MALHLALLVTTRGAAEVQVELARGGPAVLAGDAGQVQLQVGPGQARARLLAQLGHPLRGKPEHHGGLAGARLLDLGVPQHRAPPLGQRQEGAGQRLALRLGSQVAGQRLPRARAPGLAVRRPRGPAAGPLTVGRPCPLAIGSLAVRRRPGLATGPLACYPPDGGQQVRPHRRLGPAAPADHRVQPAERLRDHLVRLGGIRHELAGQAPRRRLVPLTERGVGGRVPGGGGADQLGVADEQRRGG